MIQKTTWKNYWMIMFMLFMLSHFGVNAQNISSKNVKTLEKLEIEIKNINFNDEVIQNQIDELLFLEKKRKQNKTPALVLTSLSVIFTASGILSLTYDKASGLGRTYQELIGGTAIGLGVVCTGVSIPLYKSAKKREKKRNELIQNLNR